MPPLKQLTDEEKNRIADLYQSGLSLGVLYRKYGYSNPIVNRVLEEKGIKKRPRNTIINGTLKPIVQGEPIDCSRQGGRCIYRNKKSGYLCDYCAMQGVIRGGSPHECTKYVLK